MKNTIWMEIMIDWWYLLKINEVFHKEYFMIFIQIKKIIQMYLKIQRSDASKWPQEPKNTSCRIYYAKVVSVLTNLPFYLSLVSKFCDGVPLSWCKVSISGVECSFKVRGVKGSSAKLLPSPLTLTHQPIEVNSKLMLV